MLQEKVKYKLINHDTNTFIWLSADDEQDFPKDNYPAPINWDDAEKTLKRSTKTYGIVTELSKNLEFVKGGYDFLLNAFDFRDIQANVTLEEHRTNPVTEVWYKHSTGVFDFSEYSYNETSFKVPFKSSGLNATIEAYQKDTFELQRTESITGVDIGELTTKDVLLTGRDIFRVSELNCEDESVTIFSGAQGSAFGKKHREPIPVKLISNSDEANVNEPFNISSNNIESYTGNGGTGEMFFLISDVDKTNVRLHYEVSFRLSTDSTFLLADDKDLRVHIKRYNGGNTFNFVENLATIIDINNNVFTVQGQTFTAQGLLTIPQVLTDESLSFVFEMEADYPAFMRLELDQINAKIRIEEDSVFQQTTTKAINFNEGGKRLMQILTGENNRFYSDLYTNGTFKDLAFTSGFYVRQFYENNIELSLKNYLETSMAVNATGYGLEFINGIETLVVEDLKYFFQDAVAIKLPFQVKDIKRQPADDLYASTLVFGYKKPTGDRLYEEAMGLDEYNTKTEYVTNLDRTDKELKFESAMRADKYGVEFARRKPKLSFPEQDTRYDKDLFLLDLKQGLGTVLEERTWQDDFEQAPTGIYSPETATNLRLTPREINNRWQWFYGAGLQKFQDEKVRFSSSVANSDLATKKVGEPIQYENGDINVSDLAEPRFYPQYIEFEHEITYEVNQMVYGTTNVNGRDISNFYFKVEFINEFNQKEYGYLFELKGNRNGKFKLLKGI